MPPKKRAVRVESDSAEEEEEEAWSQSQSTQTQLPAEERKGYAGKICNYLLINECKKIPSKPSDMKKLVLRDKGRHFNQIMIDATKLMEEVYGYNVVVLKTKDYILLNTMNNDGTMLVNSVTSNDEVKGLLTIMLIGIFMSGGVMHEGPMREYLKNFDVDLDSKVGHPVFGNIDKLVHQDLKRQQYLDIAVDKSVDPSTREYRWGERADLELPKRQVLELVCKVYGNNMRPEMWLSQWRSIRN